MLLDQNRVDDRCYYRVYNKCENIVEYRCQNGGYTTDVRIEQIIDVIKEYIIDVRIECIPDVRIEWMIDVTIEYITNGRIQWIIDVRMEDILQMSEQSRLQM